MAIELVGSATAGKAGASSGNSTIALNSGLTGGIASSVSNGDLVIAAFASCSYSINRTLAITDGTNPYTLAGSELYAADNYATNLRVAYKFVSGDIETTFGPTGNSSDGGATAVRVFRGVDPTTPLDVSVTTATGSNSILANPPAITPATAGSVIACFVAGGHLFGTQTFSSSDLTDFINVTGNDVTDVTLGSGLKTDWTSGAFDPDPLSFTFADDVVFSWAAITIALRPAGAGSSGRLKVWNGSAWVAKPVKVWNGSSWVAKPVKRWNGSTWITTPY